MRKLYNFQDFVRKSTQIHGEKYTYDQSSYKNTRHKTTITCPQHGEFTQLPSNHLSGHGCVKCRNERYRKEYTLTTDEFVRRSNVVHQGKYDYSKTVYIGKRHHVSIICPRHGEFRQLPQNHMRGSGCSRCHFDSQYLSLEEFIDKSNLVHNHKYDYSRANYTGCLDKLTIVCPTHGEFEQVPHHHLSGNGCPGCRESSGEALISKILIKHSIRFVRQYTIPQVKYKYKYDFYLPDFGLLVEFHGEQHYKLNSFFHKSEEDFTYQKERDMFKRELAKLVGVPLLVLSYKHKDKLTAEQFEELLLKNIMKTRKKIL